MKEGRATPPYQIMATLLIALALIPVLIGVLITGDFTQKVYKPTSLRIIYRVFRYRYGLMALSAILWLAGVIVHFSVAPTNPAWLVIVAGLIVVQAIMGFFMSPYIAFPQVKQPQWRDVDSMAEHLALDEAVLGVEVNGDARAFPVKWLERPHIVKAEIGGVPVTMTYCMLSNLGVAYRTEQNGEPMDLIAMVQWENNLVLYNTARQQAIQQIDGTISYGEDAGQQLVQYPTWRMSWRAWQELHPESAVFYHPPVNAIDRLARHLLTQFIGIPTREQPEPWFRTIARFDNRLPNKTRVIGVRHNRVSRAYTPDLAYQVGAINDELGGQSITVFADQQRGVIDVFDCTIAGQVLSFEPVTNSDLFVDHQTQTQWNINGEALSVHWRGNSLSAYLMPATSSGLSGLISTVKPNS